MSGGVERDVQVLWDLETLGITESDGVHEDFGENIAFNGNRYSVKLPWKEGRNILNSNCELSLSRLKGQVRKLRKEPGVQGPTNTEPRSAGQVEKIIGQVLHFSKKPAGP